MELIYQHKTLYVSLNKEDEQNDLEYRINNILKQYDIDNIEINTNNYRFDHNTIKRICFNHNTNIKIK